MAETVIRIKICGITCLKDALFAVHAGADAVGFVFAPSPRRIMPQLVRRITLELPPLINRVGVFMDMNPKQVQSIIDQTGISVVQLHGNESPEECQKFSVPVIKRIKISTGDTAKTLQGKMRDYNVSAFVLDPGEGSGQCFDWTIARSLKQNIIIAGGLRPDNVGGVIKLLQPYGVDVCSGVEKSKGVKDRKKVIKFICEVRKCSMP